MILATDVHYHANGATAAGVVFEQWCDEAAAQVILTEIPAVAEYIPGQFYQRELPCLLQLLQQLQHSPDCIIVDGFVYLDGNQTPGLGKHLYDALQQRVPVIGVAKSSFHTIATETQLLRGQSQKPLYITAVGMPLDQAKQHIAAMLGEFRLPTLLKLADLWARSSASSKSLRLRSNE